MSDITVETDFKFIKEQLEYADHHATDDRFNTALWALYRLQQKMKELKVRLDDSVPIENSKKIIPIDPYTMYIDNDYLDPNHEKYKDYKKYNQK